MMDLYWHAEQIKMRNRPDTVDDRVEFARTSVGWALSMVEQATAALDPTPHVSIALGRAHTLLCVAAGQLSDRPRTSEDHAHPATA